MTRLNSMTKARRVSLLTCVVLAVVCTASAFADDEYARHPAQLKRDILGSRVFQLREMIYPAGAMAAVERVAQPTTSNAGKVACLADPSITDLLQQYEKRHAALEVYFGRPLPARVNVCLRMNDGIRGARILPLEPTPELDISQHLLAADFRASLITASPALVAVATSMRPESFTASAPDEGAEKNALRALGIIRTYVEAYSPPSEILGLSDALSRMNVARVADLIAVRNALEGDPELLAKQFGPQFVLIDAARALNDVEKQFTGTFLFALTHELGHAALGTMDAEGRSVEWKRNAELEADRFAAFLLSEVYLGLGVRWLPLSTNFDLLTGRRTESREAFYILDAAYAESFLGYGIFFDKGYELTYGADNDDWYPGPSMRRAAAEEIFVYVKTYLGPTITDEVEKRRERKVTGKRLLGTLFDGLIRGVVR